MTKLNVLGKEITKPTQELVIMRGIPGAGKSTLSKTLVREGVIHSTDTVIEAIGDYRAFFATMAESGDYSALSKAHDTNYKNAVKSLMEGISPVIIDNTHIKANEAKRIVVKALEMGLDESNIRIADVGTGGLDATALFERGTHGVPLEKLEAMIQSYNSVGELTVQKILESKDMFKSSDILYSAVVLDEASRNFLLNQVGWRIPLGWNIIAHHMTIAFGKGVENKDDLGKEVTLMVTEIGFSDKAMAVKVSGYPSKNAIPHITIAVNPDGGKPVMSNDIKKWQPLKQFHINGVVTEIKKKNE